MFGKKREEPRNPDGLTRNEFIEKYKNIPKLAALCWYCGIKPEELKEELQRLLDLT